MPWGWRTKYCAPLERNVQRAPAPRWLARAIIHTIFERVDAIACRCRNEHPYEVVCVAAKALVAGEPKYLQWIDSESRHS